MSMSFDAKPSVAGLRAQAEASRARLTGTIGELRTEITDTATDLKERLSPSAIKAEVTDYVRDSRAQLWNTLEQKARDNPLQAVAVGAAIAFPAFKLLRAMPAPLLLVGAGLLLSRATVNESAVVSQASDAVRDRARDALDAASGTMENATAAARRKLHDIQDYAREGVDAVTGGVTAATSSLKEQVTDAAGSAKAAVSDAAEKMTSQVEGLARHARDTVSATWDQNPLLVAGIGLAVGAFIAAAFPSTKTEESLLGEASDGLRRTAEGLAAKGVDAARTTVEGVAAAASDQGLSVDGMAKLGENLTEKVRAVAERGVEAALGDAKPANPNPNQIGTRST